MENVDLKNENPTCGNTVLPAVFCREEEELIDHYMGEGAIGGYHQSWDWLMPVVDKIMRTKIGNGVEYVEYPYLRTFGMLNEETKNPMVRFNGFQVFEAETLIEATFLAVVDFLEWWSKADR